MSISNKLTALQNQVFHAMVINEDIIPYLSSGLKKIISIVGIVTVVSTLMLHSNIAHASDNNALRAMLGVSAVSGLLSNSTNAPGTPVGCNIKGVNGVVVGGSMAAGSLVGNQFGGGRGKTLLTSGLGLFTGAIALNSESQRIDKSKEECYRRIAEQQAIQAHNQAMSNHNYVTTPQSAIIYVFNSSRNNEQIYITMDNSPAIQALRGINDGRIDPNNDPQVSMAIQTSLDSLINAYNEFAKASDNYIRIVEGTSNNSRSTRYAVTSYQERQANNLIENNREKIQQSINNWDAAFNRWARERAGFVALADGAVAKDNIQISSYHNALQFMTAPPNAMIACECNINQVNRFSTVPTRLTIDR